MLVCGTVFTFADSFRKISVNKQSPSNPQFIVNVREASLTFAKDQYVAGANVSMKNTSAISCFISYNMNHVRQTNC